MDFSTPYAPYVIAAYGIALLCLGALTVAILRRRRIASRKAGSAESPRQDIAPEPRSGSETGRPHDRRPEGSLPQHLMAQSDAAEEREIDA